MVEIRVTVVQGRVARIQRSRDCRLRWNGAALGEVELPLSLRMRPGVISQDTEPRAPQLLRLEAARSIPL